MLSDEVIERFKAKIPTIRGDHTIYGITQLDIKLFDGTVKQIGDYSRLLVFTLRVIKLTCFFLVVSSSFGFRKAES